MYPRHGRVYAHRTEAEAAFGPLPPGAVIHHKDRNPLNNAPDNLVVCKDQAEHMEIHRREDCTAAGFDPDVHLHCFRCDTYHERDAFARNPAAKRGYSGDCKVSFNEYRKAKGWNKRAWRSRHKEAA